MSEKDFRDGVNKTFMCLKTSSGMVEEVEEEIKEARDEEKE